MTTKINLLIHVGFGKTATTWMQKQVFASIADSVFEGRSCIFFGKLGKSGTMLDDDFHELHYKLFDTLNGVSRYRSRNSMQLVSQYAKYISDYIRPKGDSNVIISNETLAGYGGYNAELNMFLLKMVIDKVEENLGEKFDFQHQILVTFREQVSLLQSHYSYDYYNQSDKFSTFDSFLSHGIENHHNDIFGSLWLDEVIDFMWSIFSPDRVIFTPYELLVKNKAEFLRRTVVNTGLISEDCLTNLINETMSEENANRSKTGKNLIRDLSITHKILVRIAQHKNLIPKFLFDRSRRAYIFLSGRQRPVIKGEVLMNRMQKNEIRNLYRASNTRAAELLSMNLGDLGYAVMER